MKSPTFYFVTALMFAVASHAYAQGKADVQDQRPVVLLLVLDPGSFRLTPPSLEAVPKRPRLLRNRAMFCISIGVSTGAPTVCSEYGLDPAPSYLRPREPQNIFISYSFDSRRHQSRVPPIPEPDGTDCGPFTAVCRPMLRTSGRITLY